MAGAAPLPMRRHLLPGPVAARPATRPVAPHRRDPGRRGHPVAGSPGRRHRLEGLRRPVLASTRPSWLADRLRTAGRTERLGGQRHGPAHRPRRRPADHQRGRTSSRPSSTRRATPRSGIRRLLAGLRPGMTEQEAVASAGLERDAPLVPPDAHRRPAGLARAAQPDRPGHRPAATGSRPRSASGARSPVARGSWSRMRPACHPPSATTSSGSSAPYFEAVAEWYETLARGRAGRRAPGGHRPAAGRPVLRHLPQPGAPARSSTSGSQSPVWRGSERAAPIGHGAPGGHHPGHRHRLFHDATSRTASRSPTRQLRDELAERFPDAWERTLPAARSCRTSWASASTPEVLPLSNMPAYLPPFLLRPDHVMTCSGTSTRRSKRSPAAHHLDTPCERRAVIRCWGAARHRPFGGGCTCAT